jgi:hypothetical protein
MKEKATFSLAVVLWLFIPSATVQAQWRQPQNVNMYSEAAWSHDASGLTAINVWLGKPGRF